WRIRPERDIPHPPSHLHFMFRRGLIALLLILLVANALLLAAVLGVFGPQPLAGMLESPREPQRVDQQVRIERMELQPPGQVLTPASAPRGSTSGTVALAAATPDNCMEMGGFTAQAVQHAKEDLAAIAAGTPLPVDQFERSEQVRWWV